MKDREAESKMKAEQEKGLHESLEKWLRDEAGKKRLRRTEPLSSLGYHVTLMPKYSGTKLYDVIHTSSQVQLQQLRGTSFSVLNQWR